MHVVIALQLVKRLREHTLRYVWHEPAKFSESVGLFSQCSHQQRTPLAADDVDDGPGSEALSTEEIARLASQATGKPFSVIHVTDGQLAAS